MMDTLNCLCEVVLCSMRRRRQWRTGRPKFAGTHHVPRSLPTLSDKHFLRAMEATVQVAVLVFGSELRQDYRGLTRQHVKMLHLSY